MSVSSTLRWNVDLLELNRHSKTYTGVPSAVLSFAFLSLLLTILPFSRNPVNPKVANNTHTKNVH